MEPDFDTCYRALQARDARFDGLFFVGVGTTDIYCRSICAARTPRAGSCRFFPLAANAEQAGFRPCLRCRPELAPGKQGSPHFLEQAIFSAIQEHALKGDSLGNLTQRTGYSARQMRRLIVRAFGVTPVAIAQTQRLLFAKKLLQETSLPIARVAVDAGFGSLRRFNFLFQTRYGRAPQTLRRESATMPASDMLRLRLAYRPPLAWSEMLAYLRVRAIPQVESVNAETYSRTVSIGNHSGWLTVRNLPLKNSLEVTLPAGFSPVLATILQNLRRLFDLDANPHIIAEHLGTEAALGALILKNPGLRVPGACDVFELSIRAILGQQISVVGATTLAGRLALRFGKEITTPNPKLVRLSFTAETLADLSPEEIASVGLPKARARCLHEFARATAAGILNFPPGTPPSTILQTLQSLPGIGPWTANYIAMRGLRLPDAFPTGDLGLLKATGLSSIRELEKHAERWRPWRAYATLHLWQSLA